MDLSLLLCFCSTCNWESFPTEIHPFVEYTSKKGFDSFVQLAVDARIQSDENPNSTVTPKTMKLLANSCYDYQNIDRRRQTVLKYLSDGITHAAMNNEFFRKLDHLSNALNDGELAKTQIERTELILIWFFILVYAKLGNLELY